MDDQTYTPTRAESMASFGELYELTPDATVINIPDVAPSEKVTLEVVFTAPKVAGRYISYWKMVDCDHNICFPDTIGLSVCISVKSLGIGYRISHEQLP